MFWVAKELGGGSANLRQGADPRVDEDSVVETAQVEDMLDASVETLLAHLAHRLIDPPRRRQHPHQVRAVDDATTSQISLAEEPCLLILGRLRVECELECRRQ